MRSSQLQVGSSTSKLQQFPLSWDFQELDLLEDSLSLIPFYEPTSVLDPHLSSSPAVSEQLLHEIPSLPPCCWDDPPRSSSEDWDLVTLFLGSNGEQKTETGPPPSSRPLHQFLDNQTSSPLPPLPVPTPFISPSLDSASFDSSLILLIRAAQAVEANDVATARAILAQLSQPISSAAASGGRPVQRAALYFLEALQSLLKHEPYGLAETLQSPSEMVQQITAHRAFSELCPVFHFTCFTANQAILETLDRSRSVHLIDFDVGLGAQWSSFLHEIAAAPPPSIRITAIVREEYSATKLSAENLRDFAKNLGLEFTIEFVRAGSLGELRLLPGDSVAVSLTPSSFRLFGNTKETARQLLRFISNVSPRVTVFADTESSSHSSFRRCFVTGLENSSALLESLDSAAASVAIEDEQMRRIEQFVVKPKIFESLYTSWSFSGATSWRDLFLAAAMKPIPFSSFAESQAELLTASFPSRGFQVERRDWSMVLGWRGKDLACASAWRCC